MDCDITVTHPLSKPRQCGIIVTLTQGIAVQFQRGGSCKPSPMTSPDVDVTLSPVYRPSLLSSVYRILILFSRTIWYLVLETLIRPIKSSELDCCPFDFWQRQEDLLTGWPWGVSVRREFRMAARFSVQATGSMCCYQQGGAGVRLNRIKWDAYQTGGKEKQASLQIRQFKEIQ